LSWSFCLTLWYGGRMSEHDYKGNCTHRDAVYGCDECGHDNACDVCHEHCEPRGECSGCLPKCEACIEEHFEAYEGRSRIGNKLGLGR
jgi:hypothetical protein